MSELKKDDLVMTEHGLAWYENDFVSPLAVPYRYNVSLLNTGWSLAEDASPATREQVEAYLKEKGWDDFCKTATYGGGYYRKRGWDVELYKNEWIVDSNVLFPQDFDTAPEQLAEAILMARLLNAVKEK